jgi:hypothetical protein
MTHSWSLGPSLPVIVAVLVALAGLPHVAEASARFQAEAVAKRVASRHVEGSKSLPNRSKRLEVWYTSKYLDELGRLLEPCV